jgi:acetyltransferase
VRPHIGLNATPLKTNPEKANIAFISQSGAFGRALLDWGIDVHMGFSMFASLGSMIDIDFGDLIDFLGQDPHTRSIMLYIEEEVGDVKQFASAARGFARNKPIVVLKPPRRTAGADPALSHTGQLATHERVYNAVFKRVGVVRVKSAADLFNTAGVLEARHLPKGTRLMIITNASGLGVMATNALNEIGGRLARCSEENEQKFRATLPSHWNPTSPIDILRDADVERYERVVQIGLADSGVDGVLVILPCREQPSQTSSHKPLCGLPAKPGSPSSQRGWRRCPAGPKNLSQEQRPDLCDTGRGGEDLLLHVQLRAGP